MNLNRRFRLLTVLLSLWALLFAQGVLAAYACPGVAKAVEVAQMVEAGMPCAETMSRAMDDQQPSACHAHCQSAQQSSDSYQPPSLASAMQLGAVLSVPALQASALPKGVAAHGFLLPPGASPPLAIVNCCFRI